MYNEIGSEFWDTNECGGTGVFSLIPYKENCIYTLCGRTALDIVIDDIIKSNRRVRSAYLPSYCCHTMIEPFVKRGIKVSFYDVYTHENKIEIDFDDNNCCDIVFFLDYFGFKIDNLSKKAMSQHNAGKTVICDATHSFFCKSNDYSNFDYVFASLRKWVGVNFGFCSKHSGSFGNYSLRQNDKYTALRNKCFCEKAKYIRGEINNKEHFLARFADAENMLETDYEFYAADERSIKVLSNLNVEHLVSQRRENALKLIDALKPLQNGQFFLIYDNLPGDCVPLFLPIEIKCGLRSAVRKRLIDNKIYCPVHWPTSKFHAISQKAEDLYNNEMSLICDQRYSTEEMNYISYNLNEAIKNVRLVF